MEIHSMKNTCYSTFWYKIFDYSSQTISIHFYVWMFYHLPDKHHLTNMEFLIMSGPCHHTVKLEWLQVILPQPLRKGKATHLLRCSQEQLNHRFQCPNHTNQCKADLRQGFTCSTAHTEQLSGGTHSMRMMPHDN